MDYYKRLSKLRMNYIKILPGDKVKLIDFGLSNFCGANQMLTSSCGSPCYASPEMISCVPYYGIASDLWSCGVVLYCMLVGCLPFDDDDIQCLYKKILIGEFVLPSTLSSESIDLLKRILLVVPKKRITVSGIKKHKWFNKKKFINKKVEIKKRYFINI